MSPWQTLVFPALFTAGMALVDTTDSVLMTGAYGWAFSHPFCKLWYNLTCLEPLQLILQRRRCCRDRRGGQHDYRRMTEREEEADADRPLAVVHQLARDVVDRGDMVGVDRVTEAEHPSQGRRA